MSSVEHGQRPDPMRWWTLGAVCVATFMLLLDITIVNVALPDIQQRPRRELPGPAVGRRRLRADARRRSCSPPARWPTSSGRRRVFVVGPRAVHRRLAAVRAVDVADRAQPRRARCRASAARRCSRRRWRCWPPRSTGRERGTALGVWGATTGASVAVGPLVGGVLVEHVSWQSIFFVNLPIGIAAIARDAAHRARDARPGRRRASTRPASSRSRPALFALVFALVRGNTEGWGSTTIVGLLVASAVLLVAFVRRRAAPGAADARPLALPQADLRRRLARRPSRCRPRCSRCSCT